ncbi:SHQ1-domain-containing protein [Piromyces finnis]|uniref:SHQ1-domain-containing protein n=1 Tax=Piromyces finnis TaxID=1754191 RepID=A0A1Y1V0N4_9FUNG|nr:SHQ1-domain-containing protein [Piromyces finnis]|eukprot:ORX44675.1 SHQ1-domain-containing protein [Piromyces finnis]
MITPSFQISQDENFINIIIKCPYIKAQNVEFFVDGTEFKFYIKPYYLRLNLPGKIVEDGREKATYNIKTSEVTVRIPKETPGEFFQDLNLLTNLMAKSKKNEKQMNPLVEVLNSEGTLENQPRLSENDEIDWDLPQELPKTENNDLLLNSHYGFDNKYTGLGRQLQEIGSDVVNREFAEVLDTSSPESRRALRLIQEDEKFDDDYYMDNFINNEEIKYFLKYKPKTWTILKKIQKEKKDELTQLENKVSKMNIDMDVDLPNTNIDKIESNSYENENLEIKDNKDTSDLSSNKKPITTSNVLIELENTLNNYEVDYQQLNKKKGPLIIDLSEDDQLFNSNKSKTDTKDEVSFSNENEDENKNKNENKNDDEMFNSSSTFNITNTSENDIFKNQDFTNNKTQKPLIIELDFDNNNNNNSNSNNNNDNNNDSSSKIDIVNIDTKKLEVSKPSVFNNVQDISDNVKKLDENIEWIEKQPIIKSLDDNVPINRVMNELKPLSESSTENQMQIDEEKIDSFFKFTEEENRMMTNLPNIEFNIINEKALYLGLVDLLFAYSYDNRTTEGESTVESPWTIVNLSSSLSCFDTFTTLKETLIACIRRSLCYPLYRNFDLSMKCIMDIYVLFKLGKVAILKALLHMKKLFESQESYYIYNRCWIDDYCIWVQRCSKKVLKSLASELHTFKVPKQDIGFDLEECEMIAKEIDAIEEDE